MKSLKNIDTAFKYTKNISFFIILISVCLSLFTVIYGFKMISKEKNKIYVLVNNKALEIALLQDLDVNRKAEIKNQAKLFHNLFFSFDPDMEVINENVDAALVLADNSVKQINSMRNEKLFYHNLVQGGISTQIKADSIKVDMSSYPYRAMYYGKQRIIRSSNITLNNFVSSFKLRNVTRTDNNSHGLYIENYEILNYETINSYERK